VYSWSSHHQQRNFVTSRSPDRVTALDLGKVICHGTPAREHPTKEVIRGLLGMPEQMDQFILSSRCITREICTVA